jgi:hypothetical protein
MTELTARQAELCERSTTDYSDLKAFFINCTLKRGPERSHTQGLMDIAMEIMRRNGVQVDGIRARAKSPNNGPWVTDYGAMGRKTVLKRISAWLPLKPEIRAALERDTEREIAAPPTETAKSRTAEVRERVRARSTRKPATDAPGAAQPAEGQDAASPSASASQQPEPAAEGDVREVCGESSDPKLGAVETCVLAPGHQTADGASQIHQSKDGSVWPAVKP